MNIPSSILAPSRTRSRAAFRRVAGGALSARGRGQAPEPSVYAQGVGGGRCFWTGFTGFRRVEGNAPYQLQRFERAGVEEKLHDAHEGDAALVAPGLFMEVAGDHHLAEIVVDAAKGWPRESEKEI